MAVLKVILGVVLILFSIGAIALVVSQEGNDGGMSSIMGGSNADSEFGRKGGKNQRATRWTTICAVVIMVLAVAIALISKFAA